jgi:hypothetical protein
MVCQFLLRNSYQKHVEAKTSIKNDFKTHFVNSCQSFDCKVHGRKTSVEFDGLVLKYHFQFRLQFLPEMTLRKAEINRITADLFKYFKNFAAAAAEDVNDERRRLKL